MQKKKVLAILLAVVMVLGLCSMASAAAPNDKVQINNMMVDAALAEEAAAQTAEVATLSADDASTADGVVLLSSTTSVDYPPIYSITMGSKGTLYAKDNGTNVQYFLHVPGGNKVGTKTFNFTLSSTSNYTSPIVLTYAGSNYNLAKGTTNDVAMTLTNGAVEFDLAWDETHNSTTTHHTAHCVLTVDVSQSVELYHEDGALEDDYSSSAYVTNSTGATTAKLVTATAGGVTRYTCAITLPAGASNTSLNVEFILASAYASATLGGVNPSNTEQDVDADVTIVTFNGVDLSTTKELVITNGSASRTYLITASAAGSTVTVHIALRTFLADEYLENRTNWYDGYGTSSVSSSEKTRLLGVASYLRGANVTNSSTTASAPSYGGNAPISKDTATGRMIFNENSYVTLTVPASYTVKDVLDSFTSNETYFPGGFYIQAAQPSYIEAMGQTSDNVMGEFDCGYASGWMYTVRTSSTDTDSALPNAAASTWPISNGVWIDWYYTAAYGMDFGYSMFG